jgi:hypothetical protein
MPYNHLPCTVPPPAIVVRPCRRSPRTCQRLALGKGLQSEAEKALAEAEALKFLARLKNLKVWEMEKTKTTKGGIWWYRRYRWDRNN